MNRQPEKKTARTGIRWMLVGYDTLLLIVLWCFFYLLEPTGSASQRGLHLAVLFICFTAFRMVFRAYSQIWRMGAVISYAREMAADLSATAACALICRLAWDMPLSSSLFTGLGYTVASLLLRIAYGCLYRLAKGTGAFPQMLRKLLTVMAFVDFDSPEAGAVMRLKLEQSRRSASPINNVQRVAECFAIRGDVTNIIQINKGYINQTYCVETLSDKGHVHRYTLQRINTNVFPDVDALMANYVLTTTHLQGKFLLPGCKKQGSVQTVRVTKDGRSYLRDDSGCWRMLSYFGGVYSLDIPDSPKTFYYAGRAFGKFIKDMADVSPGDIAVVIPNFHNTRSRYEDLESAIARDPVGRAAKVEREIAFVRARKNRFGLITDALETGLIPTRVCHNDCNLNNILFDEETHLPVAIIDLDTVMPSSPLYDFGDSMRIGTNTATDDEKDLSKVSCDLNLYEQYARGYLQECGALLTSKELELLPYAALIITAEDGIRFLMDHINGDTYYHIYYPGQNLDRARTQLKLLEDMESKLPQIVGILQRLYGELHLNAVLDREAPAWQDQKAS